MNIYEIKNDTKRRAAIALTLPIVAFIWLWIVLCIWLREGKELLADEGRHFISMVRQGWAASR
jgi:hypothetical protein